MLYVDELVAHNLASLLWSRSLSLTRYPCLSFRSNRSSSVHRTPAPDPARALALARLRMSSLPSRTRYGSWGYRRYGRGYGSYWIRCPGDGSSPLLIAMWAGILRRFLASSCHGKNTVKCRSTAPTYGLLIVHVINNWSLQHTDNSISATIDEVVSAKAPSTRGVRMYPEEDSDDNDDEE